MRVFRNKGVASKLGLFICAVFLISVLPVTSSPHGTGETILTNYEILEHVSSEAIDEMMANMPPLMKDSFIMLVRARSAGNMDFIFENMLLKKMKEAGFRLATKSSVKSQEESKDESDRPDYEFSYQLIRMTLQYPDIGRSYWVGAKEVERRSEVGVFCQLADLSSGDIIWVGETEKKYEDRIAYSSLEEVEDPQHDFTRPARNELKWSNLVEPVVVAGIVTGLVYLFFSNQSSN